MAEEARNKYQEWEQRRKEKLEEITSRIEEGMARIMDSSEFKNYLSVMASFYNYSARNTLLIFMQKPDATLCASYTDWQRKYNRQVNKGEKGIQIIAPAPYKMKVERDQVDTATGQPVLDADGNPVKAEKEITVPRFKVVSTFDLSQTSGEPLPELGIKELTADVEHYEMFMEAIKRISPVPIRFDEIEGGAKGYYDPVKKEIVIQDGMPQEQTMKTCVHELTHSMLHDKDTLKLNGEELKKDRMTIEIEAEACAFVCLSHFGFEDVGDYSFPYLTSWSSGRDMKELHASLSTIQKTSSQIISGIEKGMREQMLEQDVDRFEIYQIPIGSENRDKKFVSMDEVTKTYGEISRDDYALVYTSPLKDGETLDSLYEKFNIDPPTDYAGHSMSVSDVVVLHQNHEDKAYYVDSMGFKEIPFAQGEPYVPGWDKDQQSKSVQYMAGIASPGGSKAAIATEKGYFTIQQDGKDYDYTFYDKDFKEYHSGSLVDSGMNLTEAIKHVLWHSGETISNEAVVYGDIASKIDEMHKSSEARSVDAAATERIADQLPQQGRRESILRSLRDKQQKVNAEFGIDRHGHKVDQKRGEQTL
ncbi:MAG: hypothetical protein IJJ01_09750 [Firmicutes bacterium]|nr:hypothetical protein [Bacillota bacterium]